MAKKKHFYYVLVFTGEGPVYVTSTDNRKKVAHWKPEEPPKEFEKEDAAWIVVGLNLNGTSAQRIDSPFPITTHPYNYESYNFEVKKK